MDSQIKTKYVIPDLLVDGCLQDTGRVHCTSTIAIDMGIDIPESVTDFLNFVPADDKTIHSLHIYIPTV